LPAPGTTPTCDTAGVLGTVPQIIAAFQVTEALKVLTGQISALCRDLRYVDVWHNHYERVQVAKGEVVCPACDERRFEFLEGRHHTRSETLCGRDAVQVRPAGTARPDFAALAERLATLGDIHHNAYLLRFAVEGCEMTLFQDGRAIIQGTSDAGVARSLYTRYIGL